VRFAKGSLAILMVAGSLLVSVGTTGQPLEDGDYEPLTKKPPIYPRAMQLLSLEGYCIVEYTVTESGTVEHPFPTDCRPAGLFEGVSIEASLAFTYRPRVVGGQAQAVKGVSNKFVFDLLGGGIRHKFDEPVTFTDINHRALKRLDKYRGDSDWAGLKRYAEKRIKTNRRFVVFAGYGDIGLGNTESGYQYLQDFLLEEPPPFEAVTLNALQILAPYLYRNENFETLIALDENVRIWAYRLQDEVATNRVALLVADAYRRSGRAADAELRFQQIVERASKDNEALQPFVDAARSALQ
jgi:hypothetical protein